MATPETLKPETVQILTDMAADYWRAHNALEAARQGLTSAVLDAKLEAMPVKDIVAITRWSRTQVNSIKQYPTSIDQSVSTPATVTEQPPAHEVTVTVAAEHPLATPETPGGQPVAEAATE